MRNDAESFLRPDTFETLLIEDQQNRLIVQLHRPDVRNAIDQTMVDELHRVCTFLERSPKILILTGTSLNKEGNPKAFFASGADIGEMRGRRRDDALRGINSGIFDRLAKLPMPTIAALDGFALGGGAELAFAADFRIGTRSLRMGNPETGLGIMAAAGATWRLRELVGEPLAKELLLTGRILTGRECLEAGLINAIVDSSDLMDAANSLADRIAAQDPLAVRITKMVLNAPRGAHPLIDTLAQGVLFESEAKVERMQAFLDRKKMR